MATNNSNLIICIIELAEDEQEIMMLADSVEQTSGGDIFIRSGDVKHVYLDHSWNTFEQYQYAPKVFGAVVIKNAEGKTIELEPQKVYTFNTGELDDFYFTRDGRITK